MMETTELIDRYIAIWNETDPASRRALITQTWEENGVYCDPLMEAEGHDGISRMSEAVQQQFPGLEFRRNGDVDRHHDCLRFRWELGPVGDPAVAGGVDFGVVVGERLQSVTGFIDFMPSAAK